MVDINTFLNMNVDRFESLNQDFRVIRDGVPATSKKNLTKYNNGSYTKCEFLNKKSLQEFDIKYSSVTDIKNRHKASRRDRSTCMTERKNLRSKVKNYMKSQLLAPEKLTTRSILNNLRLNFDQKLVTFRIEPSTNEILHEFHDF